MTKLHHIALSAILLLGVVSCAKEDTQTPEQPESPTETAYFKAGFGATTYATPPPASADEKQLRSVAFFIQTQSGDFLRFFSDEAQGSAIGFVSTTPDADGNITGATMKIDNTHSGNATVTVIGNYVENGLTADLKAVTSPAHLSALIHTASATGPSYPLVTIQQKTVNIQPNASGAELFSLKRLAARIDVTLNLAITAYDEWNDPVTVTPQEAMAEGYFSFAEAYVLNPQTASYLLPGGSTNSITQAVKHPAAFRNGMTHTFYTYEMAGGDTDKLQVIVVYNIREKLTDPFTQKFYHLTLENSAGNSVVVRNSYYAYNDFIITLNIADEWDEGGMIIGG